MQALQYDTAATDGNQLQLCIFLRKAKNQVCNSRTISLISCVDKAFERVVLNMYIITD